MAGTWTQTKPPKGRPGIYVQETARGGKRYKVAFRDANGTVTSKTFDRLDEAKVFQDDLGVRRVKGDLPDTAKGLMPMSALWGYFSGTRETRGGKGIKPSTFASYESRWAKHIAPHFHVTNLGAGRYSGGDKIKDASRDDIKRWLIDLQGRTSLDTRRKVQQVLHKLFAVAVREGWLTRNPVDNIGMPGAEVQREPRPLTDAEVEKVAAEVPPRYQALVWTLAESGMRISEAVALRVKNLNGSIRVVEGAPEVGGKRVVGTPKTAGSIRNVPLSPNLRAILAEHLNLYANRFDPESLVFTGERGAPISQSNFRKRVFQPAAVRAGLDPVPTVHDLRHTSISLWLQRGLTPFEVSKIVGHTTLRMIEQRYGHLYEDAVQKKIDALG